RTSGCIEANGQRDRDRQVLSEPATRVPERRTVQRRHRIDFVCGDFRKKRLLTPLTLLAGALLLATCDGSPRQQAGIHADAQGLLHYGALSFEPCALPGPGCDAVEAQCTTLEVPEDHASPDIRRIELAIALVSAKGLAEPDPIYMIARGPGQ